MGNNMLSDNSDMMLVKAYCYGTVRDILLIQDTYKTFIEYRLTIYITHNQW